MKMKDVVLTGEEGGREGYIPYIPSGKKAIANHIVLHFDMVGEKKKRRETGDRRDVLLGEGGRRWGTECKMKQVHPQFYSPPSCCGYRY